MNLPRGYQCKGSEEKELPEQAQKTFFAPGKNTLVLVYSKSIVFYDYFSRIIHICRTKKYKVVFVKT